MAGSSASTLCTRKVKNEELGIEYSELNSLRLWRVNPESNAHPYHVVDAMVRQIDTKRLGYHDLNFKFLSLEYFYFFVGVLRTAHGGENSVFEYILKRLHPDAKVYFEIGGYSANKEERMFCTMQAQINEVCKQCNHNAVWCDAAE